MRFPLNASTTSGYSVPKKTTKQKLTKRRLLKRNRTSNRDDGCWRGAFQRRSASEIVKTIPMKTRKYGPIWDSVKEWTLSRTPLRVRNVPNKVRRKVKTARTR